MSVDCPVRVVVADANVLINLMHISRLELCGRIPGYEFVLLDHVREEIRQPSQRLLLDEAIKSGLLGMKSITEVGTLSIFSDLVKFLGRGEAACLALAVQERWSIASDEKRRFRREVEARLGSGAIVGTRDLLLLAIEAAVMTVSEADLAKHALEERRFKMEFHSFGELVRSKP